MGTATGNGHPDRRSELGEIENGIKQFWLSLNHEHGRGPGIRYIGKSELRRTEVHLDQLVQETLGDFEEETKERNITWAIHPLPGVRAHLATSRFSPSPRALTTFIVTRRGLALDQKVSRWIEKISYGANPQFRPRDCPPIVSRS